MVYSKTKRTLEKTSCVIGIIASIILIGFGTYWLVSVLRYPGISGLIIFLFISLIGVAWLTCSIICVRSPLTSFGTLKKRKAPRIVNGIISGLASASVLIGGSSLIIDSTINLWAGGKYATLSFGIALIILSLVVLAGFILGQVANSMPDFVKEEKQNAYIGQIATKESEERNSVISKIEELKHYKDLGVISEDKYNEEVKKYLENLK